MVFPPGQGKYGADLMAQWRRYLEEYAEAAGPSERATAALGASFPLLSLMTLFVDQGRGMASAVRQIEQRFAEGGSLAGSDWEQALNALYRLVEMMQLFAILSDAELRDQVQQIAARFKEEDQVSDLRLKLRNGFCRTFELAHLVTTQLDEVLPA